MSRTSTILTIAVAAFPSAALAGGPAETAGEPVLVAPAPEMRPSQDWTGFYVGGQIGRHALEFPSAPVPGGIAFDGSGATYGLHAGYNRDLGRLVIGAEASVDFSSTGLDVTFSGAPAPREVTRMAMLKAKVGYDAGRLMPYALVGYAWQTFDDTTGSVADQTFNGLAYGIGVNVALRENLIAGAEAVWFDLDPSLSPSTLTSEGTAVSLRLSYKC